jgi:hypothetical protein
VDIDAIGALSRECNRDGDQLLVLYGNDSVRDRGLIKCPEGLHHFGRELVQFFDPGQIFFGIHNFPYFFSKFQRRFDGIDLIGAAGWIAIYTQPSLVQRRTAITSRYSAATSVA